MMLQFNMNLSIARHPDILKENTMLKLQDMCLNCISRSLDVLGNVGQSLAPLHKEMLLKRLADHDLLTKEYLPHVTYNLFSSSLQVVSFYRCDTLMDSLLQQLGNATKKLRKIMLHKCDKVTDVGIIGVTSGQTELVQLKLVKLTGLTSHGLSAVHSPRLESVKIRHCNNITADGICDLIRNNSSILKLRLIQCSKLRGDFFPVVADVLGPKLEELDVADLHTVGDSCLEYLADRCPNLTYVNLSGLSRLTHASFTKLAHSCSSLHVLDISYLSHVASGEGAACLLNIPLSLTELSLCGIYELNNEDLFVEAMTRLVQLTNVRLSGVPALTDSSMERILSVIGANLKQIDISGSVMSTLTDECLEAVAHHCPNLELIAMGLLREVTGLPLVPVFNDPARAAKIRTLLINTRKMTMEVLHAAAANCQRLCDLDVSGLSIVDDTLLYILAENCPHLSNINLKGCVQVTDAGVVELAWSCPLLRIVLAGVHQLTDKSIFVLANSCPYLEEIYLNGCAYVTNAAVMYLTDCCIPRLFVQHKVPNASPNQVMAKNLDTGEFCRVDLMT